MDGRDCLCRHKSKMDVFQFNFSISLNFGFVGITILYLLLSRVMHSFFFYNLTFDIVLKLMYFISAVPALFRH